MTKSDTDAQFDSSSYAVSDADTNIDGSTGSAQANTLVQVTDIKVTPIDVITPSGNSTVSSAGYVTVSSVLLFVFALLI